MSQYPALAVSAFVGRWRCDSRCTAQRDSAACAPRPTHCVALRVGHGGATSLLPMRVLVRCLNPPRRQRPTLIPSECSTHSPQWGRGGKAERLAGGSGAAGGRVRRSESDAPSPTLRVRRSESDAPSPTLRVRRSESSVGQERGVGAQRRLAPPCLSGGPTSAWSCCTHADWSSSGGSSTVGRQLCSRQNAGRLRTRWRRVVTLG
jgi:hypothetical protein